MRRPLLALLLLSSAGAGCSYTTTARAPVRGELWIGDEEAGEVDAAGGEVRVPVTYQDPAWHLYTDDDDEVDAEGVLPRTRVEPFTAAGLFGCASVSVPACMSAGFCVANPASFVLCLGPLSEVLLVSGLNAVRTSVDNPSWPTVPVVMGAALVGLTPLLLLPLSLRVPDELALPVPPTVPPAAAWVPEPLHDREVAY